MIVRGRAAELHTLTSTAARRELALVVAAPGMGVSCLLGQAVDKLAKNGHRITRICAGELTSHIPLGSAMSELGSEPERSYSQAELLRRLVRRWSRPGRDGLSAAVIVDDAHHLDRETAAVLGEIASRGLAGILLGASRADEGARWLTALCKDRCVERLVLGPVADGAAAEIVSDLLGDTATPYTVRQLTSTGGGVPGLLHDLVAGSRANRTLYRDEYGVWHLTRPPAVADDSRTLAVRQVWRAGTDARFAAACLAAAGEPVALTVADAVLGHDALAAGEAAGLIRVAGDGADEVTVDAIAHATSLLCDGAGVVARQRFLARLIDHYVGTGRTTGLDALRIVRWSEEIGTPPDPVLLETAAAAAVADCRFGIALQLARCAGADWDTAPGWALTTAAQAALWLGHTDAASTYLERARSRTARGTERATIAIGQAAVLFQRGEQLDEAQTLLCDTAASLEPSHPMQAVVVALRAGIALNRDRAGEALALVRAAGPGAHAAARATAVSALVELGRPLDALAAATPSGTDDQALPTSEDLCGTVVATALGFGGQLGRAVEATELGHARAASERSPAARAVWAMTRGHLDTELGSPAVGLPWLLEAARLMRDHSTGLGPRVHVDCLAAAAIALADAGRHRAARRAIEEARLVDHSRRGTPHLALARVRTAEDPTAAARLAADLVARMLDTEMVLWQARGLLALAQRGRAEQARELLDPIAPNLQGPVLAAWVNYVGVLARPRRADLATAGRRFRGLGLTALADDADRRSRACSCGNGRRDEPFDLLTDREREIATAVATGGTSREVAARLSLSHRTVEAHLQRVYDRLRVHSRAELTTYLTERGTPSTD